MIRVVLAALAVVSLSSAFPFIHPQQITPEIEEVPQIYTGLPLRVVPEPVKKTGVQNSGEVYTPTREVIQPENTETQVPSEVDTNQSHYSQKNTVVSQVQNAPVNVEHPYPAYTENPVLLPIQPLSVVSQGDHVWRPVIVPAEAIAEGRVIIAAVQSNQQRSFPVNAETYVPYQEPVQVQPYQQSEYVQTVEKQTSVQEVQHAVQGVTSDQVKPQDNPVVNQQTVSVTQEVQKNAEPVENQNQVPVESNPQVYNVVPNVQSVATQVAEHQVQTYTSGQTAVEVQPNVQEQQPVEKQVYQQGNQESVVQNQNYEVQTPVAEGVKQQVPYQYTVEKVEPNYNQQQVSEVQASQQEVNKCSQVQYQPAEQVQTVDSVVATETENQAQYQKDYVPVHVVEPQTYQVQAVKQTSHQEPVQVQTVEPVYEQFQSVEPVSGNVAVNHQQFQTPEQAPKTSRVEQEVYVQHPETVSYEDETVHHFGDKISQVPVHSVPVTQSQVPSVGTTQK